MIEIAVEPIASDKLLDSNGAGDSFVGGFLAKASLMLEGQQKRALTPQELTEAVQAGNRIAGLVVQQYGCSFPSTELIKCVIRN